MSCSDPVCLMQSMQYASWLSRLHTCLCAQETLAEHRALTAPARSITSYSCVPSCGKGPSELTCEVKATENSRMPADTTDRLSWAQKLSQPTLWQALAVRSSDFLAGSDMVITWGLVDAGQATCKHSL